MTRSELDEICLLVHFKRMRIRLLVVILKATGRTCASARIIRGHLPVRPLQSPHEKKLAGRLSARAGWAAGDEPLRLSHTYS